MSRFDEFKGPRLFDRELGAVSRESAMGTLREAAHLRNAVYCTSQVVVDRLTSFSDLFPQFWQPCHVFLILSVEAVPVAGVHPVDRRLPGPALPPRPPHRHPAHQARGPSSVDKFVFGI